MRLPSTRPKGTPRRHTACQPATGTARDGDTTRARFAQPHISTQPRSMPALPQPPLSSVLRELMPLQAKEPPRPHPRQSLASRLCDQSVRLYLWLCSSILPSQLSHPHVPSNLHHVRHRISAPSTKRPPRRALKPTHCCIAGTLPGVIATDHPGYHGSGENVFLADLALLEACEAPPAARGGNGKAGVVLTHASVAHGTRGGNISPT